MSYCRAAKCRHIWQDNCYIQWTCLVQSQLIQGILRLTGKFSPLLCGISLIRMRHIIHTGRGYPFKVPTKNLDHSSHRSTISLEHLADSAWNYWWFSQEDSPMQSIVLFFLESWRAPELLPVNIIGCRQTRLKDNPPGLPLR